MPQGKGTYGSQVGRPSKKRTSYVNDNGWTRRFRKQSGNNPERGQSDHIVGESVRKSVGAYNDILKDKQMMESDSSFWDQGFSEGIAKVVNFGRNLPENFKKKYNEQ